MYYFGDYRVVVWYWGTVAVAVMITVTITITVLSTVAATTVETRHALSLQQRCGLRVAVLCRCSPVVM